MNTIKKIPLEQLGYNFIAPEFLPPGKDEFYLRNIQNRNGIEYRKLTAYEIEVLVRNRNTSDNWNYLLVSDAFNPELVKNCKFYGLVRIGKLEPYFLENSQLKVPVGLYNSTIISCDFGDNVVVDNVNYLSHYIIGSEVIIVNVNELMTTPHAKFGNGILKEGEPESVRIWLELCNENGGRSVIPFNGMLPGDAWLWTKYRDNTPVLEKFKQFTQDQFDTKRGYYGKVGDRTVIKNCAIIKDVWIGSDAYLKGANKLKNLTINSQPGASTQIGEGCELVNGIIGYGCRIFYGVKAVRFITASHSQLKYGARLINSYLGQNATISCCEVLNSLIFPSHEQHHNNSFLCAALIMGQSNMAAGSTIGSNHNSRGADGELIAGRGFWPGLCVSLKHNSRFASFTIIAKGDYPSELDIPFPFSLVSQEACPNELQIMPAYWFMYNMYALARNAWKYQDRDKRIDKTQYLEFDFLAPDTVSEMLHAMQLLETLTGHAWYQLLQQKTVSDGVARRKGESLFTANSQELEKLSVVAPHVENSKRPVRILKPASAWHWYRQMVWVYGATALLETVEQAGSFRKAKNRWPKQFELEPFTNVGGQLMKESAVQHLLQQVKKGSITCWEDVHEAYRTNGEHYLADRQMHALATFEKITGTALSNCTTIQFTQWMQELIVAKTKLYEGIVNSRAKDYDNPFRKMVYNTQDEMDQVMGRLQDNSFLQMEKAALAKLKQRIKHLR